MFLSNPSKIQLMRAIFEKSNIISFYSESKSEAQTRSITFLGILLSLFIIHVVK
jgi:hypothetical protein